MSKPIQTIHELQQLIKDAKSCVQFAGFRPSLEDQLENWTPETTKLWFDIDVSNGCGQAFAPAAVRLV